MPRCVLPTRGRATALVKAQIETVRLPEAQRVPVVEDVPRVVRRSEDQRRLFDVARQVEDERLALRRTEHHVLGTGSMRHAIQERLNRFVDGKGTGLALRARPRTREARDGRIAIVPVKALAERAEHARLHHVELAVRANDAPAEVERPRPLDGIDGEPRLVRPLHASQR